MKYIKNINGAFAAALTAYWFVLGFIVTSLHIASTEDLMAREAIMAIAYLLLGLVSSVWASFFIRRRHPIWMNIFISAGYIISSFVAYFVTVLCMFLVQVSRVANMPAYIKDYLVTPLIIVIIGNIVLCIGVVMFFVSASVVRFSLDRANILLRKAFKKK